MRLLKTSLISLTLLAGTAALAQTPPAPAVGDTVFDSAGAEVGKVTENSARGTIVDTGTHKVAIPTASFARNAKGLVLAATKAQVDAFGQQAEDAAKAALAAALVPGATVSGINGTPAGTVKSVSGGLVEVTTPKGDVKLPSTAIALVEGGLRIGMTQAEFDAAVTAAVASN